MMRSQVIPLMMILMIILSILAGVPPPAKAKTIISGEWDVFDQEIWVDDTIEIKGNITIHPGGSLTLRNVIIYFNQTRDLEFGLYVLGAGGLTILDGSKVSVLNQSLRAKFEVHNGASFIMSKSTLDRIGRNYTSGVKIYSSRTTIKDSTISNSSVGLDASGVNISVSGMYFYGDIVGIRATGSNITISKSTVTRSLTGIESLNSTFLIENSKIEKCNYGIILNTSAAGIKSTNILSNLYGLMSSDSHLNLISVSITQSVLKGMTVSGSTLNATSLTLSLNPGAVEMINYSRGEIRSSILSSNTMDYSLTSSTLNITDTTFTDGKISLTGDSNISVFWSIRARTVNETNYPVSGATVTITHSRLNYSWNGTTNSAGYAPAVILFSLYKNKNGTGYAGEYIVEAEYQGSKTATKINLTKTTVLTMVIFSPPPPLSVIRVEPQMRSAMISWTKYSGTLFYSYSIFLSLVNGSIGNLVLEVRDQNVTSVTLTSLKPSTEYFVTIRLLFKDGRFSFGPQCGFRTLSGFPRPHYHLGGIDITSGVMTLSNGTYFVNGEIRVHGHGLLRVINATVVMNNTLPVKYRIRVFESGALQSEKGIFTSLSRFTMEINSSLSLKGTVISNLSGEGLIIRSNSTSILNTTFIDSDSTIRASGVSVTLVSTMFSGVSDGPYISSGFAYISNATAVNVTHAMIFENETSAIVKESKFLGCVNAISVRNSTPVFDSIVITSGLTGIDTINARNGVINDVNISGATTGILIINSSISLLSSRIEDSDTGISIIHSDVKMENTETAMNHRGVYASDSNLSINGGTVEGDQSGITAIKSQLTILRTLFRENDESITIDGCTGLLSGVIIQRHNPMTMKSDIRAEDSNLTVNTTSITSESDALVAKNSSLRVIQSTITRARICFTLEGSEAYLVSTGCMNPLLYGIRTSDSVLTGSEISISEAMLGGIYMLRSHAILYNSTITSVRSHAELIDSTLTVVSTQIDPSYITLSGKSAFERRWFLSVSAQDSENTPLRNVTIDVIANQTPVGRYMTNLQGVVQWIEVPVKRVTPGGDINGNPVRVKALIHNRTIWKNITMTSNAYLPFLINPPPLPVSIRVLGITEDSVTLEWKPAGTGEVTRLDALYRMINETNWRIKGPYPPAPVPILIKNLTPYTSYAFRIRCYNREGVYNDSEEVYATTLKPNHLPEITIVTLPVTVYENEPVKLLVSVVDADGDTLEYVRVSISGSYMNMRQADHSSYELNCTFVKGKYTLFFEASDGKGISRTEEITLTVVSRRGQELSSLNLWLIVLCGAEGGLIAFILISGRGIPFFRKKKEGAPPPDDEDIPSSAKNKGIYRVERPLAKRYRIPAESDQVESNEERNESQEKSKQDS